MLRIMLDTRKPSTGITCDTELGPYPRLTPEAVERARTRLRIGETKDLAQALGFSRQNFWRVRRGEYDIRLQHALNVAAAIGWPLSRCFLGTADTERHADAA